MTRYNITPSYRPEDKEIDCPFCGKKNPGSAYCCIHCYKVIKQNYKKPIFKFEVRASVSIVVVALSLFAVMSVLVKHWIDGVEASMNMQLSNAEYDQAMAEKKVRESWLRKKRGSSAEDPSSVDPNAVDQ